MSNFNVDEVALKTAKAIGEIDPDALPGGTTQALSLAQVLIADAMTQAALEHAGRGVEPVAAQHRFRHPQKTMPGWSAWQPTSIDSTRPANTVDSQGWEVEYRELYAQPPAPVIPECFMRLYRHAKGLSFGHDWDKGAAQGHHRKPLVSAVRDCHTLLSSLSGLSDSEADHE